MNVICVSGNISRGAETRFNGNGKAITNFSLADNQGKDKVIFWDCVFFGERGEKLAQYLVKGASITVSGRCEQDEWEDKQTGAKRTKIKIVVSDVALQGGKQESAPAQQRQAPPAMSPKDWDDSMPF